MCLSSDFVIQNALGTLMSAMGCDLNRSMQHF
ncbi:hypothetical protein LCGC14_2912350, partial [marine sediment metagenome]